MKKTYKIYELNVERGATVLEEFDTWESFESIEKAEEKLEEISKSSIFSSDYTILPVYSG